MFSFKSKDIISAAILVSASLFILQFFRIIPQPIYFDLDGPSWVNIAFLYEWYISPAVAYINDYISGFFDVDQWKELFFRA